MKFLKNLRSCGRNWRLLKQDKAAKPELLLHPSRCKNKGKAGIAACATSPMSLSGLLAETEVREHPLSPERAGVP